MLRLSRQELQRFMDLTPDAALACRAGATIVAANERARELFGHAPESLVGANVELLIPENLRSGHRSHFERYERAPYVKRMRGGARTLGRHFDGTEIDIDTELLPVQVENEIWLLALIRDARDLRKTERELARLNEEKNEFLGLAAHDVRSPVGAIRGYAEILQSDLIEDHAERQGALRAIIEACDAVQSILDDLLDVSAIESGKLRLDLKPAAVEPLIAEAVRLEQRHATTKEIKFSIQPLTAGLEIVADRRKILQVLQNLISNAVKYSPPHSVVRIACKMNADRCCIEVNDAGAGISAEDCARLFQAFARAKNRTTGGESSTGLGLVIVRRIVEAHGGRAWVESQLGKGSTFYVDLPARGRP